MEKHKHVGQCEYVSVYPAISRTLEAEHNPPDSILDERNIEVDQQAKLAAAQLEISKDLSNMDVGKQTFSSQQQWIQKAAT